MINWEKNISSMHSKIKDFEFILCTPEKLYVTTPRWFVNIKSIYLKAVVVVSAGQIPIKPKASPNDEHWPKKKIITKKKLQRGGYANIKMLKGVNYKLLWLLYLCALFWRH